MAFLSLMCGLQYWVDGHSIIVNMNGAAITHAGKGPASLGEQKGIGLGVVVVVVVGGPVYIHFLEYEFSHLNFINNGTNISGKSNQV